MSDIYHELEKHRNFHRAKTYGRFFKTGKGEYGEGDKFLGVRVPVIRRICKNYPVEDLKEINKMISSEFHEVRFAGLVCLRNIYEKNKSKKVVDFYLKNARKINNWDLVDTSTPYILGDYILENKKERKILDKLVKSKNIWERRIAVLATFPLIKNGEFKELKRIAKTLLKDKHDLIHKSVGWMLREAGKVDQNFLIDFLDKNKKKMPRTMLRYSIEKFSPDLKEKYLSKVL